MMKQIDCRGLACPQPVLRAKDALEQGEKSFAVLVDNEASRDNILRFGHSRNCQVEAVTLEDGCFLLNFSAGPGRGEKESPGAGDSFDETDYQCAIPEKQATGCNLVYAIGSDTMGRGSDELGWALLQTYISTIKEISPPPRRILFYNGGVRLVATPGKALEALRDLEKNGVQILSCGTCLDFFKLGKNPLVGKSTNMFELMDSLVSADKVVSPF
jgi:selenium metabolism protein YedF